MHFVGLFFSSRNSQIKKAQKIVSFVDSVIGIQING